MPFDILRMTLGLNSSEIRPIRESLAHELKTCTELHMTWGSRIRSHSRESEEGVGVHLKVRIVPPDFSLTQRSDESSKLTLCLPQFRIQYRCIVFRPFKGEVIDSVVTNVTKVPPLSPRAVLPERLSYFLITLNTQPVNPSPPGRRFCRLHWAHPPLQPK